MSLLAAVFASMSGTTAADVTPNAVNWGNITGVLSGTNANQTLNGTSASITISVTKSPIFDVGIIEYDLNGAGFVEYTAPFVVDSVTGQTLRFQVSTDLGAAAATVTVKNDTDGGATLDTFTYNLSG